MNQRNVYVISGGSGATAELLFRTAIAQFPGNEIPLEVTSHARSLDDMKQTIADAENTGGLIIHTLVSQSLRESLKQILFEKNIESIDLMGPILNQLSQRLENQPLGRPGLYRQLRQRYYKRIEAIEYAVEHDDGQRSRDWHKADLFILGVSRSGKTPLCMYLAFQGLKTANLPLVLNIDPPSRIFELNHKKMIGLTIDIVQLMTIRRVRQQQIGMGLKSSDYINAATIDEELKDALRLYRRLKIPIIDVTNKPIEETAKEILSEVS